MTHRLVLLRHGQSEWNLANRFTGWTDVALTKQGKSEAATAGRLLREKGLQPDLLFTSVLRRAIDTADIALEAAGWSDVPTQRSWRLNERHYGALQGLNKKETAEEFGAEQVHAWRRSYDIRPPALDPDDERHPKHDPRYAGLAAEDVPSTECLEDVVERMLPYWHGSIAPEVRAGKTVLIAAHGNSLRALVMHLDGMSKDEIVGLNIPTGIPLVYTLDEDLGPVASTYLGDQQAAMDAAKAVGNQAG